MSCGIVKSSNSRILMQESELKDGGCFGSTEGGCGGFLLARGDRDERFEAAHVGSLMDGDRASGFWLYRIRVAIIAGSVTLYEISTASTTID